jgi:hypothetical protein
MRRRTLSTVLLLAFSGSVSLSEEPPKSEKRHLTFSCADVSQVANEYFAKHGMGIEILRADNTQTLSLIGSVRSGGATPWTDAKGNKINDAEVYWMYTNKSEGEKLPFGMWRLRLDHYAPRGNLKLAGYEGGCNVDFALYFETGGANVVGIFPLDSSWANSSNGRLEREYLDGIYAALIMGKMAANERQR